MAGVLEQDSAISLSMTCYVRQDEKFLFLTGKRSVTGFFVGAVSDLQNTL